MTFTIDRDEDGVWIAECPSITACVSQGETKEDAVENVREAIRLCLEVRAEKGMPLVVETRQVEVPINSEMRNRRRSTASDITSPTSVPADETDLEIPEIGPNFFENGTTGKYYFEMMRESNVVRIAPNVTEHFPNERAVNDALRTLIGLRRILDPGGRDREDAA